MNSRHEQGNSMRQRKAVSVIAIAFVLLVLAGCSSKTDEQDAAPAPVAAPAAAPAAVAQDDERTCTNEPHTDENDKRPRCGGMAAPPAPRAYRIVVGGGDPVDQVVCDIDKTFVLEGKMFGTEFSGGMEGTYKMVRTPNIPGLNWKASGTYRIDLPNGPDAPGTLSVEAHEATTRAGAQVDENAGHTDTFNMTPVEACKQ